MGLNAKCSPFNNTINSPTGLPLPGLPGFAFDINFPSSGLPGLDGFPENILSWLNKLKLKLPGGGSLQTFIDSLAESVAKILSNLLNYINIFMGFYYFVLAIVEFILCIIKVLCAMPKPWSIARAMIRLIRKCLPIFITIAFPFFALLILLMSLIAILIALIEYIIEMIKRLIKQLLKNLKKLRDITIRQYNPNAALAIANKVANLLCLFEQIFGFLGAVFAVLEMITSKWDTTMKTKCGGGGGGDSRDPDDDSVCAAFMENPIEQIDSNLEIYKTRVGSLNGELWYCNQVFGLLTLSVAPPSPITSVLRNETVYLKDDSLVDELKFHNIISSSEGFTFFPFDKVITKDTAKRMKPYFVDMYVTTDPGDGFGNRKIQIKDITVTYVTTSAMATAAGATDNPNGYLVLSGGSTQDEHFVNKTIEELLSKKGSASEIKPSYGIVDYTPFTNIEYSLNVNFDALLEYSLITFSCLPAASAELGFLNTTFAKAFNNGLSKFVKLPNIGGAIDNLGKCLDDYKANISIDTTETFGNCMLDIMDKLNTEANDTYCQLVKTAMDINNMQKSLSTDLEFVNNPITVTITPKDQAGRTLKDMVGSFVVSKDCLNSLFTGEATLGEISDFSYDDNGNFTAQLTSDKSGSGTLTLYYVGDLIPTAVRPTDPKTPPHFDYSGLNYTFIGVNTQTGVDGIRRDESDSANVIAE